MYTQKKKQSFTIFDHGWLGLENKLIPDKITQSPTYTAFIL